MKSLPYVLTRKAVLDLEAIWLYTVEKWSIEQADRYYSLIVDEIKFVSSNPQSGKPMDHVRKGYRASKVKSHLIFYRITNQTVEVTRILHEQMDIDNLFGD
jgi:toxin ParE1/3/4